MRTLRRELLSTVASRPGLSLAQLEEHAMLQGFARGAASSNIRRLIGDGLVDSSHALTADGHAVVRGLRPLATAPRVG